ncbi:uncharacterized protein LOC135489591 isoform X2 [Lineus longissimus]|uniref:uncharacterized protein LOC135489591 isoform X2 n=1 Tax=Lineus longissimus TaxID=88925 RepID=UPI002B4C9776
MEKFYVVRKVDRGQRPDPNQNVRPAGQPPPTIGYPQPIVPHSMHMPPPSGANRSFTEAVTPQDYIRVGPRSPSVGNRSFKEAVAPGEHTLRRRQVQEDYSGWYNDSHNNRPHSTNSVTSSGSAPYSADDERRPHSINESTPHSRNNRSDNMSHAPYKSVSVPYNREIADNHPDSSCVSVSSKPTHSKNLGSNPLSHPSVNEKHFSKPTALEKIPRSFSDDNTLREKAYANSKTSSYSHDLNKSFTDAVKSVDCSKSTSSSNSKLARSNMYNSMPSLVEDPKYQNVRKSHASARIESGTDVVDSGKVRSKPPVIPKVTLDVGHGPLMQKIMILCDGLKFGECSVFINRLSQDTLTSMLPELPIQTLLDAIPKSLGTLHTIYSKILPLDGGAACAEKSNPKEVDIIKKALRLDETLRLIVKFFACQEDPLAQVERSESVTFHCKGVLKIIAQNKQQIKQKLYKKKKALERCLSGLGQHGPIPMQDGKLASLHDALKQEFTRTVHQYKNAMLKLEESPVIQKATSRTSMSSLSEQNSHQRMLQCNQLEVENRLIKNKTLFNAVEPVITNQFLCRLIQLLEERITCDKAILFHFTELRKQSKDAPHSAQVAPFFHRYSTAYSRVLEIIQDVTHDETNFDEVSDSDLEMLETWSGSSIRSLRERNPSAGSFGNSKGYMQLEPLEGRGRSSVNGAATFGGSDSNVRDMTYCTDHFPGFPVLEEEASKVKGLAEEVEGLTKELNKAKETIAKLEEREKMLKERMTAEAQKGIQSGTRFEDLNLGENRPTQLVRRYGNLYSQVRVDTLDALDSLDEVAGFDDLKGKLLFSVVVLAFRSVQETFSELKTKLHSLLQLPEPGGASGPDDTSCADMERSIIIYLKKTADRFDLTKNISEVSGQLWQTLYDYPSLKSCQQLHQYIDESVRLAWALSVQNPPLVIDYDAALYKPESHSRFYLSEPDSTEIKSMIWPALLEGENGPCVSKGIVLT